MSTIPEQAISKFMPEPSGQRKGIGLSLSGGGFRAPLFHMGAMRRLGEFGIPQTLRTISSVSGGSIFNGFLASRLSASLQGGIADYEREVTVHIREFCANDLRRWLGVEALIPGAHNSKGLAKKYDELLTAGKLLADIPDIPIHIFCATDLAFGVNWMFKRQQCGDYKAGFMPTPQDLSLGIAVAASSCFPPVFQPLNLNLDPAKLVPLPESFPAGPTRDKCIRDLTLSDGGVYDNLGLEPIWKDHEYVVVSDGGALFPVGGDNGFAWEIGRFISIPENQALALRRRWLISNFISGNLKGTYWGVGGACSDYGLAQGYSKDLAENFIAKIRTDLDAFSEVEASVLENHGYWLADAAFKKHLRELLPITIPDLQVPNSAYGADAEGKIKEALKDSSKRSLLGHGS